MLCSFISLLIGSAEAADLFWDGHYRVRSQYFNSLSLSNSNPNAEGSSNNLNHRLRLQPSWRINHRVSVHSQFDVLPYSLFGDEPVVYSDPTRVSNDLFFSDSLQAPQGQNLQVTRAWGEVKTHYGIARFGRMPFHWGSGMVYNAGNRPLDEFGNSVDQIQFTGKVQNFYLMAGIQTYRENQINQSDDTWGGSGAVLYSTERNKLGMFGNFRTQNIEDAAFWMLTMDLYGSTKNGPLHADIEMALNYGRGDLEGGINDVNILSFGTQLDTYLKLNKYSFGVGFGFAQGDGDENDTSFNTFRFNPDYNIGLLMFEEPMPTLQAAIPSDENQGREYGAVRTGYGISNAIYLRPKLGYTIVPKRLTAHLNLIMAWAASVPEAEADNKSYGTEVDASLIWKPYPNFELQSTAAIFAPGNYYSSYVNEDLGGNFDASVFGLQFLGSIQF